METKAVLVVGNFSDGFTFVGPFDSFDDAAAYDDLHYGGMNWVASLCSTNSAETEESAETKETEGMIQEEFFNLCRDGNVVFTGIEADCMRYIHRQHCYSYSHALQHEGYSLEPAGGTQWQTQYLGTEQKAGKVR